MVATDRSDGSNHAIDFAAKLAKDDQAELVIAYVVGGYGLPGEVMRQFTQAQSVWLDQLLSSAELLAKARDRARTLGAPTVRLESRSGEVAPGLVDIAQECHADLIIVGKRGAGQLERLLLGSISQKLVNLSQIPVTVVP